MNQQHKPKTIAIQGVKGAFHEQAALNLFGSNISILPCITFKELVEKVCKNIAEEGVMAIENTISGTIIANLDLIRHYNLTITAETFLRIEQNLGVLKGGNLQTLKEVHSHYMALNQCRDFFADYEHIQLIESNDTAQSLKEVAEKGDKTIGAIGSALAIEYYGLENLAQGIESDKLNYTRFVVVSTPQHAPLTFNKISATMVLPHISGSLSKVLSLFYLLGVNLTK